MAEMSPKGHQKPGPTLHPPRATQTPKTRPQPHSRPAVQRGHHSPARTAWLRVPTQLLTEQGAPRAGPRHSKGANQPAQHGPQPPPTATNPIPTPEDILHPPQHSGHYQNIPRLGRPPATSSMSRPQPILPPAHENCRPPAHQRPPAQSRVPGHSQAQGPATRPPEPKSPRPTRATAQGRHTPRVPRPPRTPRTHPSTARQPDQRPMTASTNYQRVHMQPPEDIPQNHQGPPQ
ncbi:early nodulin-75-like, partial [Austrofundulus limnaeus]|uniref:Early nodulin-75-like n=1 Tax=Austrofundulus limnaeus TaxID=52670 RepID=A0A2I4CX56_AUSLI